MFTQKTSSVMTKNKWNEWCRTRHNSSLLLRSCILFMCMAVATCVYIYIYLCVYTPRKLMIAYYFQWECNVCGWSSLPFSIYFPSITNCILTKTKFLLQSTFILWCLWNLVSKTPYRSCTDCNRSRPYTHNHSRCCLRSCEAEGAASTRGERECARRGCGGGGRSKATWTRSGTGGDGGVARECEGRPYAAETRSPDGVHFHNNSNFSNNKFFCVHPFPPPYTALP